MDEDAPDAAVLKASQLLPDLVPRHPVVPDPKGRASEFGGRIPEGSEPGFTGIALGFAGAAREAEGHGQETKERKPPCFVHGMSPFRPGGNAAPCRKKSLEKIMRPQI
jgi:hypothetical protein